MTLARVLFLSSSMSGTRATSDDDECFNVFRLICGCSSTRTLDMQNYTRYTYLAATGTIFSNNGKYKQ